MTAADDPLHASQFTSADIDRIVALTFVNRVEFYREIESTNDHALQLRGGRRTATATPRSSWRRLKPRAAVVERIVGGPRQGP